MGISHIVFFRCDGRRQLVKMTTNNKSKKKKKKMEARGESETQMRINVAHQMTEILFFLLFLASSNATEFNDT